MVTTIRASATFVRVFRRHPHPDIVRSKINYLIQNPKHNSLSIHRLHRVKDRDIWDCYINASERLLFEIKDEELCLWELGSHAVVDKAHRRRFTGRGPRCAPRFQTGDEWAFLVVARWVEGKHVTWY
jgi:mRNA-degrading endonuclease YafQ of YafQ-DinJ toxin-antitoxin module